MSHDIVADALNEIMNAKRARKNSVKIKHYSNLLLSVLAIAKLKDYVKDYKVGEDGLAVEFGKLNACRAIKPRYMVKVDEIEKYVRRYLPSRHLGVLIISTSKGLLTHQTAYEKNIGGSLIAYIY